MTTFDALPRWDATDLFPSLGSRQLAAAREGLGAELDRLVAAYDAHGVGAVDPHPPSPEDVAALEEVLTATNEVEQAHATLTAYVASYVTTDSRDGEAQGIYSTLLRHSATLRQLSARLAAWVAALGAEALGAASPLAADHLFPLARAEARAEHQMDGPLEQLYAELALTGASAWAQLHQDVTSQLTAPVAFPDGEVRTLPMPAVRGLATAPDPAVRRAAFDAELAAWPGVATSWRRRSTASRAKPTRSTAAAVGRTPSTPRSSPTPSTATRSRRCSQAVVASLPDFRRWLRDKARLPRPRTAACRGGTCSRRSAIAPATVSWPEGRDRVAASFGHYSPELRALAERAFAERWVDAEPHDGKRGGAFCMPLVDDRSLVLLNWSGSFDSVQTLAHELGHAYHNTQLADRTPMQRQMPMALAETASIFCETIVVVAGLGRPTGVERLALLDIDLQGATQVVVDIHSRLPVRDGGVPSAAATARWRRRSCATS